MFRYTFVILFLLVLVTPFALQKALRSTEQEGSHRAAPQRVVIITPHSEGIRREFQEGFSAWLKKNGEKDAFLDYRSFGGGATDIVRYFDNSKEFFANHGNYGVDMIWGGGEDLFDRKLKRPGYLQKIDLPDDVKKAAFPKPDLSGVALYDKDGFWYGTALGSFGIIYNKDVLKHLGLPEPKTWADLANPKYRGWVVLADPTRSSTSLTAFMAIVERGIADAEEHGGTANDGWQQGMGLIRQISSNARVFADASASVPATIGRGDAAAGMAIDFYGRTLVETVGETRVGYVEPAGATVINPDPIAIAKTNNPVNPAALLFLKFVLSEDGQKLWNYKVGSPGGPAQTALRRLPIRPSVYADQTHFIDKINPYEVAGSFNTKKSRTGTFNIVGELIQVSCIDLLPELRDTRSAILASPRSAELEASFGKFAFGQQTALARLKEYQGTPDKPTTPLHKLELLRRWTQEFKDDYQRYRDSAKN